MPKKYYQRGLIHTRIEVPKEVVLQAADWKYGGSAPPQEMTTLSDFRDFWNQLHRGIVLVLPEEPSRHSVCSEDLRIDKLDGSNDLLQGVPVRDGSPIGEFLDNELTEPLDCAYGSNVSMLASIGGPDFPKSYTLDAYSAGAGRGSLRITTQLPLEKTNLGKNKAQTKGVVAFTELPVTTKTFKIDERSLIALFNTDWRSGDFAASFPELSAVTSGFSTLEIADVVHRLDA